MVHHGARVVEHTKADLEWLSGEFTEFAGTEHDLRRASTTVRRLLSYGGLQQARLAVGAQGQPRFEFFPLTQYVVRPTDFDQIEIALSMGFRPGGRCFGPLVAAKAGTEGSTISASRVTRMVREERPVQGYLKSMCAILEGHQISRGELIKYVANRDGGAHHGRRDEQERYLKAIEATPLLRVGEFAPIYPEFLGIIQALTSSASAMHPFGLTPAPSPLFDEPQHARDQRVTPVKRAGLAFDLGVGPNSAT
jgi:hypothetical protein